jgi:hypothetical protein
VSRLFKKHGLSEYEVFALLMTWQHCNTAAIFHTHSSGRLFVVNAKKQNSNTTLFNEWQSKTLYLSIPKESSAGSS